MATIRSEKTEAGDTAVVVSSESSRDAKSAIATVRAWARMNGARTVLVFFRETAGSNYSSLAPSIYVARIVVRGECVGMTAEFF